MFPIFGLGFRTASDSEFSVQGLGEVNPPTVIAQRYGINKYALDMSTIIPCGTITGWGTDPKVLEFLFAAELWRGWSSLDCGFGSLRSRFCRSQGYPGRSCVCSRRIPGDSLMIQDLGLNWPCLGFRA